MDKGTRNPNSAAPAQREVLVVARNQTATFTIAELQKRCDALTREQEELRRERDELTRKLNGGTSAPPDVAAQLAEAQSAILSIRQARDSALTHNQTLSAQLKRANDELEHLRLDVEEFERGRTAAQHQLDDLSAQCAELRRAAARLAEEQSGNPDRSGARPAGTPTAEQFTAVLEERAAAQTTAEELRKKLEAYKSHRPAEASVLAELEATRHRLADLEAQNEGFRAQQKRNIAALTKHLAADAEKMRLQLEEQKSVLETQLANVQEQLAAQAAATVNPASTGDEAAAMVEQQRLEIAELSEQLQAARSEIQELRAALDEARSVRTGEADPLASAQAFEVTAPEPVSANVVNYDASITLGAMSSCLQMLAEYPTSVELLEELNSHLEAFSERAQAAGLAAIHRFSSTCGELTRRLCKTPSNISASALVQIAEAVELLRALTAIPNAGRIADPRDAFVYAVDDDPDNCECISMAFEKMRLRTKYAVRPEVALTELAASACDLIILDVDMPRIDGFELSARIRTIEHHARTPILFVSALTSTHERLKANPTSADAFIAKPYNLNELAVGALALILKARVQQLPG